MEAGIIPINGKNMNIQQNTIKAGIVVLPNFSNLIFNYKNIRKSIVTPKIPKIETIQAIFSSS